MIDPTSVGPVSRTRSTIRVVPIERSATTGSAAPRTPATSSLPRLVSLAADLAKQGPPIDYARIAQIRAAIAYGSYRVDSDAIASAILSFHRDAAA